MSEEQPPAVDPEAEDPNAPVEEGQAPEEGDPATYKDAARGRAQGMVNYMSGKKPAEEEEKDEDGNPTEKGIGERIEENPLEMEFLKEY